MISEADIWVKIDLLKYYRSMQQMDQKKYETKSRISFVCFICTNKTPEIA